MSFIQSKCIWWRVADHFKIYFNQRIESEPFDFANKSFYLVLEEKTFTGSGQDSFTLYLKLHNCHNIGLSLFAIRIFVEDRNHKAYFLQKQQVHRLTIDEGDGQLIWSINKSDFSKYLHSSNADFVDFVILCGESFDWVDNPLSKPGNQTERHIAHKKIQTDFEFRTSSCMERLSEDFCNLLNEEAETDMILKCEETSFSVHKAILSARSEVFTTMFKHNRSDVGNEGVVEITDTQPAVLKALLQYIYTGTLSDITEEMSELLYVAALRYSVGGLQGRCRDFMEENFTEANACSRLILADVHRDSNFKNRIISFIRNNGQILFDDEWMKTCDTHPKLAIEVYRTLYRNVSPA